MLDMVYELALVLKQEGLEASIPLNILVALDEEGYDISVL